MRNKRKESLNMVRQLQEKYQGEINDFKEM